MTDDKKQPTSGMQTASGGQVQRLVIKNGCRIDNIRSYNEDFFDGTYKGHDIEINRELQDKFYIMVTDPDGMFAYDGYWEAIEVSGSMKNATEQALRGSELIS